MIRKYRYGTPFDTEALTEKIETTEGAFPYGEISQKMDLLLLISWMKMILSMVWVKPTAESTREVTVISATVQMIQTIQRTSVLCTEPTTSLL